MTLLDHFGPDWQKVKFQSHGFYSVFGVFETKDDMDAAVDKLREQGFTREDISVIIPDKLNTSTHNHHPHILHNGKEGASAGVATGAVLGGTLGWLIGIGAFSVTGIGPFIAAGPVLAAITGMGIGGTVGGISGALIGYGIPEMEAKKIEDKIHDGGILLSIHCNDSDWMNRAKKLLEVSGAQEIASTFEI
jgi:uncharacterized membrane protein